MSLTQLSQVNAEGQLTASVPTADDIYSAEFEDMDTFGLTY